MDAKGAVMSAATLKPFPTSEVMNHQLMKNRPKDATPEEYKKAWENASYVIEPFWKTILEWKQDNNNITKDDFDCPNHYAKLAYQAGMNKAYDQIIALFPQSAKPL